MKCPNIKELPSPPEGKKGWPWTEESNQPSVILKKEESWPALSIVTPSFNQDNFIEETIRSVLLQGYPNLEYMIIDGKSTDKSLEIIKRYERWLTFWVSEPDSGQSEAINKGWRRSKGEILAWINSDDFYEANALEKIALFFLKYKDTDMIYGDCNIIDERGNFIKNAPTQEFCINSLVTNKWFIPQQSTFIKRKVYEGIGELNEKLHLVMDWEYWLRIALNNCKIKYYPELLSNFRVYAYAKTSSQSVLSGKEKLFVLNSIYKNKRYEHIINSYKKGAYSYVHIWIGKKYCKNRERMKAIVHFLKAITYGPYLVKKKYFLRLVLDCLTGNFKP